MISYPNQKLYHIKKKIKDGDIFLMLKWEDYTAAAKNLTPSALNLYMYLAKNQDDYKLWFSSKDYCQTFNVVDKTYRNARKELLLKGYLKEGENNNVYFDAAGGYGETLDRLKEELQKIAEQLKVDDPERYKKLVEEVTAAKLREIESEVIYKIEIKKLISFGKDLVKEISQAEIAGLL